jgi:biopolymer transport protein ExbD
VEIKKFDSINVVPFIDIMLVLLVIVLTTATFVAKGIIPVDLSETTSSTKLIKNKELTITIKENGDILFNNTNVFKDNILESLNKFKINTAISLNCDKNAKFENFIHIIGILKEKNYKNLAIVTKYE